MAEFGNRDFDVHQPICFGNECKDSGSFDATIDNF